MVHCFGSDILNKFAMSQITSDSDLEKRHYPLLLGEITMDWQSRLIGVYVKTCEFWKQGLSFHVQRMSHNNDFLLTDEEIIAVFLNGIMTGRTQIKSIYNFTVSHLYEWFPHIGTYETFVRRLNQISDAFAGLSEMLSSAHFPGEAQRQQKLVDSMPIVLAKAKRSSRAKVSPENADKGYCGSKDMFYYGVKLHVVGYSVTRQFQSLSMLP